MSKIKLCGWDEILFSTSVSVASFPIGLGIIQKFILKPLRITCKNPMVTFLFGGSSVVLSGAVASCTFVACSSAFQNLRSVHLDKQSTDFDLELDISKEHLLFCGFGSLVIFKCFGGRLRYVLPSHLFYAGAFARMSIPANGKTYASLSSKKVINSIGRKYGCHSCGKKKPKYFIADHIPPNKLVKTYQSQVFYPQCKSCSHKQGGALNSSSRHSASRHSAIQTHAYTLRKYHIWLPFPLGIAMFKDIIDSTMSNA